MNGRGGKHVRPGWKIPNGIYSDRTQQLKEWSPLFFKKDGDKNRELALKDLYRIWSDSSVEEIQMSGKMVLVGELYGRRCHRNGDPTITPYITSIKRLTHGKPCANRFPRDILCATTENGEDYFFNSDQFSLVLALIIWDLESGIPLRSEEHYYVHPDFRKEEFM